MSDPPHSSSRHCTCPDLQSVLSTPLPPSVPFHRNIPRLLSCFKRTTCSLWLYLTHPIIGFGLPLALLFANPCKQLKNTPIKPHLHNTTNQLPNESCNPYFVYSPLICDEIYCADCFAYQERLIILSYTTVSEYNIPSREQLESIWTPATTIHLFSPSRMGDNINTITNDRNSPNNITKYKRPKPPISTPNLHLLTSTTPPLDPYSISSHDLYDQTVIDNFSALHHTLTTLSPSQSSSTTITNGSDKNDDLISNIPTSLLTSQVSINCPIHYRTDHNNVDPQSSFRPQHSQQQLHNLKPLPPAFINASFIKLLLTTNQLPSTLSNNTTGTTTTTNTTINPTTTPPSTQSLIPTNESLFVNTNIACQNASLFLQPGWISLIRIINLPLFYFLICHTTLIHWTNRGGFYLSGLYSATRTLTIISPTTTSTTNNNSNKNNYNKSNLLSYPTESFTKQAQPEPISWGHISPMLFGLTEESDDQDVNSQDHQGFQKGKQRNVQFITNLPLHYYQYYWKFAILMSTQSPPRSIFITQGKPKQQHQSQNSGLSLINSQSTASSQRIFGLTVPSTQDYIIDDTKRHEMTDELSLQSPQDSSQMETMRYPTFKYFDFSYLTSSMEFKGYKLLPLGVISGTIDAICFDSNDRENRVEKKDKEKKKMNAERKDNNNNRSKEEQRLKNNNNHPKISNSTTKMTDSDDIHTTNNLSTNPSIKQSNINSTMITSSPSTIDLDTNHGNTPKTPKAQTIHPYLLINRLLPTSVLFYALTKPAHIRITLDRFNLWLYRVFNSTLHLNHIFSPTPASLLFNHQTNSPTISTITPIQSLKRNDTRITHPQAHNTRSLSINSTISTTSSSAFSNTTPDMLMQKENTNSNIPKRQSSRLQPLHTSTPQRSHSSRSSHNSSHSLSHSSPYLESLSMGSLVNPFEQHQHHQPKKSLHPFQLDHTFNINTLNRQEIQLNHDKTVDLFKLTPSTTLDTSLINRSSTITSTTNIQMGNPNLHQLSSSTSTSTYSSLSPHISRSINNNLSPHYTRRFESIGDDEKSSRSNSSKFGRSNKGLVDLCKELEHQFDGLVNSIISTSESHRVDLISPQITEKPGIMHLPLGKMTSVGFESIQVRQRSDDEQNGNLDATLIIPNDRMVVSPLHFDTTLDSIIKNNVRIPQNRNSSITLNKSLTQSGSSQQLSDFSFALNLTNFDQNSIQNQSNSTLKHGGGILNMSDRTILPTKHPYLRLTFEDTYGGSSQQLIDNEIENGDDDDEEDDDINPTTITRTKNKRFKDLTHPTDCMNPSNNFNLHDDEKGDETETMTDNDFNDRNLQSRLNDNDMVQLDLPNSTSSLQSQATLTTSAPKMKTCTKRKHQNRDKLRDQQHLKYKVSFFFRPSSNPIIKPSLCLARYSIPHQPHLFYRSLNYVSNKSKSDNNKFKGIQAPLIKLKKKTRYNPIRINPYKLMSRSTSIPTPFIRHDFPISTQSLHPNYKTFTTRGSNVKDNDDKFNHFVLQPSHNLIRSIPRDSFLLTLPLYLDLDRSDYTNNISQDLYNIVKAREMAQLSPNSTNDRLFIDKENKATKKIPFGFGENLDFYLSRSQPCAHVLVSYIFSGFTALEFTKSKYNHLITYDGMIENQRQIVRQSSHYKNNHNNSTTLTPNRSDNLLPLTATPALTPSTTVSMNDSFYCIQSHSSNERRSTLTPTSITLPRQQTMIITDENNDNDDHLDSFLTDFTESSHSSLISYNRSYIPSPDRDNLPYFFMHSLRARFRCIPLPTSSPLCALNHQEYQHQKILLDLVNEGFDRELKSISVDDNNNPNPTFSSPLSSTTIKKLLSPLSQLIFRLNSINFNELLSQLITTPPRNTRLIARDYGLLQVSPPDPTSSQIPSSRQHQISPYQTHSLSNQINTSKMMKDGDAVFDFMQTQLDTQLDFQLEEQQNLTSLSSIRTSVHPPSLGSNLSRRKTIMDQFQYTMDHFKQSRLQPSHHNNHANSAAVTDPSLLLDEDPDFINEKLTSFTQIVGQMDTPLSQIKTYLKTVLEQLIPIELVGSIKNRLAIINNIVLYVLSNQRDMFHEHSLLSHVNFSVIKWLPKQNGRVGGMSKSTILTQFQKRHSKYCKQCQKLKAFATALDSLYLPLHCRKCELKFQYQSTLLTNNSHLFKVMKSKLVNKMKKNQKKHLDGYTQQQHRWLLLQVIKFITFSIIIPHIRVIFQRAPREGRQDAFYINYIWSTLLNLAQEDLKMHFKPINDNILQQIVDHINSKVQSHRDRVGLVTLSSTHNIDLEPSQLDPDEYNDEKVNQPQQQQQQQQTKLNNSNNNLNDKDQTRSHSLPISQLAPNILPKERWDKSISKMMLVLKNGGFRFLVNHSATAIYNVIIANQRDLTLQKQRQQEHQQNQQSQSKNGPRGTNDISAVSSESTNVPTSTHVHTFISVNKVFNQYLVLIRESLRLYHHQTLTIPYSTQNINNLSHQARLLEFGSILGIGEDNVAHQPIQNKENIALSKNTNLYSNKNNLDSNKNTKNLHSSSNPSNNLSSTRHLFFNHRDSFCRGLLNLPTLLGSSCTLSNDVLQHFLLPISKYGEYVQLYSSISNPSHYNNNINVHSHNSTLSDHFIPSIGISAKTVYLNQSFVPHKGVNLTRFNPESRSKRINDESSLQSNNSSLPRTQNKSIYNPQKKNQDNNEWIPHNDNFFLDPPAPIYSHYHPPPPPPIMPPTPVSISHSPYIYITSPPVCVMNPIGFHGGNRGNSSSDNSTEPKALPLPVWILTIDVVKCYDNIETSKLEALLKAILTNGPLPYHSIDKASMRGWLDSNIPPLGQLLVTQSSSGTKKSTSLPQNSDSLLRNTIQSHPVTNPTAFFKRPFAKVQCGNSNTKDKYSIEFFSTPLDTNINHYPNGSLHHDIHTTSPKNGNSPKEPSVTNQSKCDRWLLPQSLITNHPVLSRLYNDIPHQYGRSLINKGIDRDKIKKNTDRNGNGKNNRGNKKNYVRPHIQIRNPHQRLIPSQTTLYKPVPSYLTDKLRHKSVLETMNELKRLFTSVVTKLHTHYYQQTKGIPQGNVLSSLFANLFLGQVERETLMARYLVDYSNHVLSDFDLVNFSSISCFNSFDQSTGSKNNRINKFHTIYTRNNNSNNNATHHNNLSQIIHPSQTPGSLASLQSCQIEFPSTMITPSRQSANQCPSPATSTTIKSSRLSTEMKNNIQMTIYWDITFVRKVDDFFIMIYPTINPSHTSTTSLQECLGIIPNLIHTLNLVGLDIKYEKIQSNFGFEIYPPTSSSSSSSSSSPPRATQPSFQPSTSNRSFIQPSYLYPSKYSFAPKKIISWNGLAIDSQRLTFASDLARVVNSPTLNIKPLSKFDVQQRHKTNLYRKTYQSLMKQQNGQSAISKPKRSFSHHNQQHLLNLTLTSNDLTALNYHGIFSSAKNSTGKHNDKNPKKIINNSQLTKSWVISFIQHQFTPRLRPHLLSIDLNGIDQVLTNHYQNVYTICLKLMTAMEFMYFRQNNGKSKVEKKDNAKRLFYLEDWTMSPHSPNLANDIIECLHWFNIKVNQGILSVSFRSSFYGIIDRVNDHYDVLLESIMNTNAAAPNTFLHALFDVSSPPHSDNTQTSEVNNKVVSYSNAMDDIDQEVKSSNHNPLNFSHQLILLFSTPAALQLIRLITNIAAIDCFTVAILNRHVTMDKLLKGHLDDSHKRDKNHNATQEQQKKNSTQAESSPLSSFSSVKSHMSSLFHLNKNQVNPIIKTLPNHSAIFHLVSTLTQSTQPLLQSLYQHSLRSHRATCTLTNSNNRDSDQLSSLSKPSKILMTKGVWVSQFDEQIMKLRSEVSSLYSIHLPPYQEDE